MEKNRLFVLISLCRQQHLPALHQALTELMQQAPAGPPLSLHLAARHFPSTWGRVSKSQPLQADPLTLSPDQLKLWQQWAGAGRINLVPAGYAGAWAAILNHEEYQAELEWCISNSWKSGFKDCFGVKPALLLPFWPGPGDAALQDHALGLFGTVGLGRLSGKHEQLVVRSAGGLASLPLLDLDGSGKRGAADQIRDFYRHQPPGDLVIRTEYTGQEGWLQHLSAALAELAAEGLETTATPSFQPLIGGDADQLGPLIRPAPGFGPDFRNQLQGMPDGRRGRSATQDRLRTQLTGFLPHDTGYRLAVEAAPRLLARSLLANMEGDASIMADGFEARFENGSWKGLFPPGTPQADGIRFRSPSGAGLVINGKAWQYEVESSVSFETDCSRGLRNALVLKTPDCRIPGRMMADYVLTDHSPHLLIDVQIRYPWLENTPRIEAVHPWRLALDLPHPLNDLRLQWFEHDQDPRSTQLCAGRADPDEPAERQAPQPWWQGIIRKLAQGRHHASESGATCRLERQFFGHRWVLSWQQGGTRQGLAIFRLPSEEAASAPLEIRLLQDNFGHGQYLEIFPEGRYHDLPTEDLRSLNHHFVIGILPLFSMDGEIPELNPKVEKECSRFYMIRES